VNRAALPFDKTHHLSDLYGAVIIIDEKLDPAFLTEPPHEVFRAAHFHKHLLESGETEFRNVQTGQVFRLPADGVNLHVGRHSFFKDTHRDVKVMIRALDAIDLEHVAQPLKTVLAASVQSGNPVIFY
jgi:hypothetical protein